MSQRVIFVSGPYRGDVEGNIGRAREAAIKLWADGNAVICPHLNSGHFDGPDEVWLKGYLEILSRCDAIAMMPGWEKSEGARAEKALAEELGKEVVFLEAICR